MKAYNDYSKKQQRTKKQIQDLSKFTSTIVDCAIFYQGYNTHDNPVLIFTLETTLFSLTYSIYL